MRTFVANTFKFKVLMIVSDFFFEVIVKTALKQQSLSFIVTHPF